MADMFVPRSRDENYNPLGSSDSNDDDEDDDVIDHVVLNGTFDELVQRQPNFDFMSFVLYYPPEKNESNEDGIVASTEDDDEEMNDSDDDEGNLPGRKYVWTGPDCCCRDEAFVPLPPNKSHTYKLNLIVVTSTTISSPSTTTCDPELNIDEGDDKNEGNKSFLERKIQITGPNENATSSTVAGILRLLFSAASSSTNTLSTSDSTATSCIECVTFQAFATNPRLTFPILSFDSIYSNITTTIPKLCLAFVGLNDPSTMQALTHGFQELELRQCTTSDEEDSNNIAATGPSMVYSNTLFGSQINSLVMSCTQPELNKFAIQWMNTARSVNESSIISSSGLKAIHLKLHFWLQGTAMTTLCDAVGSCQPPLLESLIIEYLDISDEGWFELFQAIAKTTMLKFVTLLFTDNFVDNYRRMTPERRTARTQAVLDCVKRAQSLEKVVWPIYQQDETLMGEIQNELQNHARNNYFH